MLTRSSERISNPMRTTGYDYDDDNICFGRDLCIIKAWQLGTVHAVFCAMTHFTKNMFRIYLFPASFCHVVVSRYASKIDF